MAATVRIRTGELVRIAARLRKPNRRRVGSIAAGVRRARPEEVERG